MSGLNTNDSTAIRGVLYNRVIALGSGAPKSGWGGGGGIKWNDGREGPSVLVGSEEMRLQLRVPLSTELWWTERDCDCHP